jgi:hypothetical protein
MTEHAGKYKVGWLQGVVLGLDHLRERFPIPLFLLSPPTLSLVPPTTHSNGAQCLTQFWTTSLTDATTL